MAPRSTYSLFLASSLAFASLYFPPDFVGAQSFGRWSWDAALGLGQESFKNELEKTTTSRYDLGFLGLGIGINGFVLHPALADFRLSAGIRLTDTDGGFTADEAVSFNLAMNVIPESFYPLSFKLGRQKFGYADITPETSISLRRNPDNITTGDAVFSILTGPLRGTTVGLLGRSIDFIDKSLDPDRWQEQHLSWRRGKRFRHSLRLRRRFTDREFGDTEDLRLSFNEWARLSELWSWRSNNQVLHRTTEYTGPARTTKDISLSNDFSRPFRQGDTFQISAAANFSSTNDSAFGTFGFLGASYNARIGPDLVLAPGARHQRGSDSRTSLESSSLTLGMYWSHNYGRLTPALRLDTGYGPLTRTEEEVTVEESRFDLTFSASLQYAGSGPISHHLEATGGLNQFRSTTIDLDPEFPDLESRISLLGTSDFLGARYTASHEWASGRFLRAWIDANRTVTDDPSGTVTTTGDRLAGSVSYQARRFSITADTGELRSTTEIIEPSPQACSPVLSISNCQQSSDLLPRQDVSRYFGLSGLIRPHRSLSLNLGYRTTLRDVLTAPDVDLTNVHLNITFRMGLLTIEGNWYRNESSVLGGPLQVNHGFRWSVRRTFGGWLPIVSAPKRNGVIR